MGGARSGLRSGNGVDINFCQRERHLKEVPLPERSVHARGLWAGHGTRALHSPSDGLAPSTKLADAPDESAVRLCLFMKVACSTWAERGGVVQSVPSI
jgi:hypothetical protein